MYLDDEMNVIDIDEAIAQKKELIEKAKELSESETGDVSRECARLRRRWRRIPYWESAYEDQLANEFDGYMNTVYSRRHLVAAANAEAKAALVEEMKKMDVAKRGNVMEETLDRWKKIGSAGKEEDDRLWKEFSTARREYFAKRQEHFEEVKKHYAEAKEIKAQLVEEARSLSEVNDFYKTANKFEELLDRWKEAGFCGDRQAEDAMWAEFNEFRRDFFRRRAEFFSEVHARQKEAYQGKKALVEEAREILDRADNTREDTQRMKDLNARWRELGSCGKDREDKIWKEFRQIMDSYFEGLRGDRQERQARQKEHLGDLRTRKLEQIASQRRQIEHLRQEALETLSEREANEIEEEIADKEEFIKELEAQIADLDAKTTE